MQAADGLMVADGADVARLLSYEACIPLMRQAMLALSSGATRQLPRTFVPLAGGDVLGVMPGALAADGWFGAKLVSVMADPARPGRTRHRGVVVLFEPGSGRPVCVVDAEEVTLRRTAAASAAATDALARADASVLAILGCGAQAMAHAEALAQVRRLTEVRVWGRSADRARAAAQRISEALGTPAHAAATVPGALAGAEVVCTVTAAKDPILFGEWVDGGAHVNLVGASGPDAAEADSTLVARSRFVVESRASAFDKAGEFLRARAAGIVTDEHIAAEIGEVMAGAQAGRTSAADVTVYKSVGHAVQDLAAAACVYEQLRAATASPPSPAPRNVIHAS